VLLSAIGGARVGAIAVLNTLVAPFLADVVGEGQGVLGDVGLLSIAADAAIGESIRITLVNLGSTVTSLLANERASDLLVGAPVLSG
jgi:hypothetical protein